MPDTKPAGELRSTPFGPLESLVGRTFEKDGETYTVQDSEPTMIGLMMFVVSINGSRQRVNSGWMQRFLRGAREVKT